MGQNLGGAQCQMSKYDANYSSCKQDGNYFGLLSVDVFDSQSAMRFRPSKGHINANGELWGQVCGEQEKTLDCSVN